MQERANKQNKVKVKYFLTTVIVLFFIAAGKAEAQVNPPRPISVYASPGQGMNFGAFYLGNNGGTVILYPDGSRSTTGDIVQASLGYSFSPAIFEVEAEPGTVITIMNGPDIQLTGSNGGQLNLHLESSSPPSPYVTTAFPPSRTQFFIGGTLTVGSPPANPAGSYSGTFSITFIQQ